MLDRLAEVLKSLKRGRKSTLACPRCRSPNIFMSTGMDGWMVPSLYLCRDCGYAGRLILESDTADPQLKRNGD